MLVDSVRVEAEQAVCDGWEIVAFEFGGRFVSVVTSVFDADRFRPIYATFRPWSDDDPNVFDPAGSN